VSGSIDTVGIYLHPGYPRAVALAEQAERWLGERGHDVIVLDEGLVDGLDVVLSLGGDGTMLRTVSLVCDSGVPVLGVNVGHLGYLTEVEPAALQDALERLVAGAYSIEERMTLAVEIDAPAGGEASGTHASLNEAVLEKVAPGQAVRLAVSINDRFFTTYAADGLIVATPTGSTAYALSARGPIVSPRHAALLLTPVAPHMLFDRTLVLDPAETIRIEVIDGRPAMLSVDGREMGRLEEGDAITCRAGDHAARLISFDGRDFHQILKAKFGLADR
jgi:NAD+ kinase